MLIIGKVGFAEFTRRDATLSLSLSLSLSFSVSLGRKGEKRPVSRGKPTYARAYEGFRAAAMLLYQYSDKPRSVLCSS